jgi:hypothetical protein
MALIERRKWIILPALLVVGIGLLEINFPQAMNGFDDPYTGHGAAGFMMLLFELFLMLTWGKVGGAIAVLAGVLVIALCFLPVTKQAKEQPIEKSVGDDKSPNATKLFSLAFRAGKTRIQQQARNKQS